MTGTRKITAWLALAPAVALVGCTGTTYEKIPAQQVNATQKAFAEQWGTKLLTAWGKGEYPQAGQEATREFRANYNEPKKQKAAHAFVKGKVGAFNSMAFHEARRSVPPRQTAYRFRGDFAEGEAEIRVILDAEGKLHDILFKPWRDEMK
jgi:hypothetical protein